MQDQCGITQDEEVSKMAEKKSADKKDGGIKMVFQGRGTTANAKPCFCACHDSYEMGGLKSQLK